MAAVKRVAFGSVKGNEAASANMVGSCRYRFGIGYRRCHLLVQRTTAQRASACWF